MKRCELFKSSFDSVMLDPQDYLEMRSEADHLGITQTELKDALNNVGNIRWKVEEYLRSVSASKYNK